MSQSLGFLLRDYLAVTPSDDVLLNGLCADSRQVKPGDLFIAKQGLQVDGAQFIDQAIANGAVAVLRDKQPGVAERECIDQVPVLALTNLDDYLGDIAARFYAYPSRQLQLIGVTGTNGKTSVTHLLAEVFNQAQTACAVMGTLGHGLPQQLQYDGFTTPDALALQAKLAAFHHAGISTVAMEVSSHALSQGRVNSVEYQTAVFTNLSRDHLDFHGDMQHYAEAKKRLFLWPSLKQAVINLDDQFGAELLHGLAPQVTPYVYSLQAATVADYQQALYIENLSVSWQGLQAQLVTPWGRGELRSPLLGRFNVSNLLAVIAVLGIHGIPLAKSLDYLANRPAPAGRLQQFTLHNGAKAIVDFAHTPDALATVLTVLRELCVGKLICVFGCGGDRDQGKRPLMGQVAEQYADKLVITNDNPRHEDPQQIAEMILQGITDPSKVSCELDRQKAITQALAAAGANDVVLIAGKGHEQTQTIGEQVLPFSDIALIAEFLKTDCK